MGELAGVIVIAVIAVMVLVVFIKANLHICPPNEVLIFSGRKQTLTDGRRVGYRIVHGRGFKIPLLENVHSMSVSNLPLEFEIRDALASGMIPLNLQVTANIKIAGNEEAGLHNAIERFLGKSPGDISQVAREVLEGNARGVLATMSPEDANSGRVKFADQVMQDSKSDLAALGLSLDTFKILDIVENHGYLESIGRRKNAEVKKEARIAEARAEAEARTVTAEADKAGSVAEAEAGKVVAEAQNSLRLRRAELDLNANEAEERAALAGEIARMEEAGKLEEKRIQVNKSKQEAETVVPAIARSQASGHLAKGDAARILETGRATAEAVRQMRAEWEKGETKELFLIQQLPDIIEKVAGMVADNLSIEKITIVDGGNGGGLPTLVNGVAGSLASVFEQVRTSTGIDIAGILQGQASPPRSEIKKELQE